MKGTMSRMDNKKCYLCGSGQYKERKGRVRDREELKIYECLGCGLVFLSSFEHIHDEFYAMSQMHEKNIKVEEILKRTVHDDRRRFEQLKSYIEEKDVLDFGCGYGGFLLNAQPIAKTVSGIELEKKALDFCNKNNIKMIGLEENYKFDVITMFHVIEHLNNPIAILKQLKTKLKSNGVLILETPNANDILLELYQNNAFQNFTYWGCHLFLYNLNTLRILVEKAGFKVKQIEQVQRYPLSNHLFWMSQGKPGGDKVWTQFNDKDLNDAYTRVLTSLGMCDTLLVTLEI